MPPLLLAQESSSSDTSNSPRAKTAPPEFVTDRPGYTETAEIVGKAVFQIESGVNFDMSTLEGERIRSVTGPFPLIRLGISKRVELRLAGDGYSWQRLTSGEGTEKAVGHSDFSAGGKVKFLDQSKTLPDFAIIAAVSVPKGNPRFRGAGYDPEVKFCFAKDAPLGFALSGNINVASVKDSDGRFLARGLSLSAGHSIWRNLSMFTEAYNISIDRQMGTSTIFNAGIAHPVGKDAQIDVLAGHSVAGRQVGWFVGIGFSFRQPLVPFLRN